MEKMQVDCDVNPDNDDNGCIDDDMSNFRQVNLLDLSDDVLLYILKLCSPRDLKALGYTCPRLGLLVQERSLWRHVDARNETTSTSRLEWYLSHMMHEETEELLISGHAKECVGCLGLINTTRAVAEEDTGEPITPKKKDEPCTSGNTIAEDNISVVREMPFDGRRQNRFVFNPRVVCLPRLQDYPVWSEDGSFGRSGPQKCVGPQFTLTPHVMRELKNQCSLTTLSLEYCNVNCSVINLGHFPKSLKKLSLRGTKMFNLVIDRSFLTKVTKCLPALEHLDLSECDWMEPSSLLPLSKHPKLKNLIARQCYKLTEFVAYASLTARYGFRTLKVLDLRGSPVGDSEVSALGWLPQLEELWLSAAVYPKIPRHAHYTDDEYVQHVELDSWELQEPEYYQKKMTPVHIDSDEEDLPIIDNNDPGPSTSSIMQSKRLAHEQEIKDKESEKRKRKQAKEETEESKKDDADDDDDDDDAQDGPSVPKRVKNDAQIRVRIERICVNRNCISGNANANADANANANTDEPMAAPPDNNVIVIGATSRNEEPQHQLYCICPEHRSVEKTDKATETDMAVCDCQRSNGQNEKNNEQNDNLPRFARLRRNRNSLTVNFTEESEITVQRLPESEENQEENKPAENAENPPAPRKFSDILRAFAAHLESQVDIVKPGPSSENKDAEQDNKETEKKENKDEEKEDPSKKKDEPQPGPSGTQRRAKQQVQQNPVSAQNPNLSDLMHRVENQRINIELELNQANQDERPLSPRFAARVLVPRNSVAARNPNLNMLFQNANPAIIDLGRNMDDHIQEVLRDPIRNVQYIVEPQHHVLYVSVGSQFNTFRFPREGERSFDSHIDSTSLVTDFSIRRFGRADGEDVNFIHFGPNGPVFMGNGGINNRPDRSNLRVLSVTGYRNITDRSLQHLASAAPHLRRLDLSSTLVTRAGVENFRNMRPDCEVVYSKFKELWKPKPK